MATITVLHNQSLLDIAIQHTGDVTNAFALAVANGISVTDDLQPGADLVIPDDITTDADILNYYSAKGLQPATGITNNGSHVVEELDGIGYWIINRTFIVQ